MKRQMSLILMVLLFVVPFMSFVAVAQDDMMMDTISIVLEIIFKVIIHQQYCLKQVIFQTTITEKKLENTWH